MNAIQPGQAFVHVQDSYRWLAASTANWVTLQRIEATDSAEHNRINTLLQNVGVCVEASALIYARGLIEFYGPGPTDKRPADIRVRTFGVEVADLDARDGSGLRRSLTEHTKPAIDQHLAHLTEFRDPAHPHRSDHSPPDWRSEIGRITDGLVDLLVVFIACEPLHRDLFAELHTATTSRLENPASGWPAQLLPDAIVHRLDI